MSAIYGEPMYTWDYSNLTGMHVKWSPGAANAVTDDRRSIVMYKGLYLPREDALQRWDRLTEGYEL